MTYPRLLGAVLAVAAFVLVMRGPSARRIVANTVVAADEGWILYKDVRYQAEWGPEIVYQGHARLFERAKYRQSPFFTHHTMLSTGDFSDPAVVEMTHSGGGSFLWTASREPQGTVVALHLVPRDAGVLDDLLAIDDGDLVELVGREEIDGQVSGSDGSFLRLTHANHKYLLVEKATKVVPGR